MPHGRISATTKRYFQNPRKKIIHKKTETQNLHQPITINKSDPKYTELHLKINHKNNLKSLLNTRFLNLNFLNLLLISGIATISSTEITCNHGFEYRAGFFSDWPFLQKANTGYRHFQVPNTTEDGHRVKADVLPLHVVDADIKDTCKSKVACVSIVRYNHIEWGCTDRATKIYHTCAENFSKLKVPVKNGDKKYPCTTGNSKKWDGKLDEDELPVDKVCMEKRYCQNNSITLPYCIPLMNGQPTWVCDMYKDFNSKDKFHNCEHDKEIPSLPENSTESDFVMKKNYYWMGTENTRYLKKNAHYYEIDRFVHDEKKLLESLPGEFHQPNILVCDTDNCNTDKFVACSYMNTGNHYNLSSFEEPEKEVKTQRVQDLNANHIATNFMSCSNDPQTTTKAYFQNFTEIVKPLENECNRFPTTGETVVYVVVLIIVIVLGYCLRKRIFTDPEPEYEMAAFREKDRHPIKTSWYDKLSSCCPTKHLPTPSATRSSTHSSNYTPDQDWRDSDEGNRYFNDIPHAAESRGYIQEWNDFEYVEPKVPIGRGKFGEIFKIRNKRTKRLQAVKVLSQGSSKEAEAYHKEFIFYEGNSNRCDHILKYLFSETITENHVTKRLIIFDLHELGDLMCWITPSRFKNVDFKKFQGKVLRDVDIMGIARSVCSGLEFMHKTRKAALYKRGAVVHTDIKPDNILLEHHKGVLSARICDFGMAVFIDQNEAKMTPGQYHEEIVMSLKGDNLRVSEDEYEDIDNLQREAKTSDKRGLQYCSPEVVRNTIGIFDPKYEVSRQRQINGQSDMYGFGLLVFELLTACQDGEMKFAYDKNPLAAPEIISKWDLYSMYLSQMMKVHLRPPTIKSKSSWNFLKTSDSRLYNLVDLLFKNVVEPCTLYTRNDRPRAAAMLDELDKISEIVFPKGVEENNNDNLDMYRAYDIGTGILKNSTEADDTNNDESSSIMKNGDGVHIDIDDSENMVQISSRSRSVDPLLHEIPTTKTR